MSNISSEPTITPTKDKATSRTAGSISPPRSMPPKPLPRVTIKQDSLHENELTQSDGKDDKENVNEALRNNSVKLKGESSQTSRTSFSGLDPKRLEQRMKRPTSAPMRKQPGEENIKILSTQEIKSSVDLREYGYPYLWFSVFYLNLSW